MPITAIQDGGRFYSDTGTLLYVHDRHVADDDMEAAREARAAFEKRHPSYVLETYTTDAHRRDAIEWLENDANFLDSQAKQYADAGDSFMASACRANAMRDRSLICQIRRALNQAKEVTHDPR